MKTIAIVFSIFKPKNFVKQLNGGILHGLPSSRATIEISPTFLGSHTWIHTLAWTQEKFLFFCQHSSPTMARLVDVRAPSGARIVAQNTLGRNSW